MSALGGGFAIAEHQTLSHHPRPPPGLWILLSLLHVPQGIAIAEGQYLLLKDKALIFGFSQFHHY